MTEGSHASRSTLGFEPGSPVDGLLEVPGSKSIVQRALLLSALREGETTLAGFTFGDDVRNALEVARALGGEVERRPSGALILSGRLPGSRAFPLGRTPLDAGESGTLARYATAFLALCDRAGAQGVVQVRGSLRGRSSLPLFEALRGGGAKVTDPRPGHWPVTICRGDSPGELTLKNPLSSQEVSSILAALACLPGTRTLHVVGEIPSRPYVDLTCGVLHRFGARIHELGQGSEHRSFRVEGPLRGGRFAFHVEPDATSAAVGLAAGCLSGGSVLVRGIPLGSAQGDTAITQYLERFGCEASFTESGLTAQGFPTRGATLDLAGEPDLAPVLAVIAAAAATGGKAGTVLSGLETLPGKESDRLSVLKEGLTRAGFHVQIGRGRLVVRPGHIVPTEPVQLDPHGDHRMAFAFALLGLFVPGIRVDNPHCVAKSWPSFWEALAERGACVFKG